MDSSEVVGFYSVPFSISEEQIRELASRYYVFVRLFFQSEDMIMNTECDDFGSYFEFKVNSKR